MKKKNYKVLYDRALDLITELVKKYKRDIKKQIKVQITVPAKTISDLQKIHGIDAIDCIGDLVKDEMRRQYNASK